MYWALGLRVHFMLIGVSQSLEGRRELIAYI